MTTNNPQITLTHDPQHRMLDNYADTPTQPPNHEEAEPLFGTHIREATETLKKLFR